MHAGVEKSGGITSVLVSMCQDIFFEPLRKDFFSPSPWPISALNSS